MISPSNNSNTPPKLAYVEVSTPDAGSALVDVVHVYNLRGRFTRTYPFGTRWMLPGTSYSQARILTFVKNPRKPLNLFETLASERVSSRTTTNPLIFIAHDSRAQIVSQELHLANGVPTAKRASFESILDLTYGVVFVRSRRHRCQRLARALILAAGHLACYIMLRNYENIHGARTETCVAFSPAYTDISRDTTKGSKTSGPSSSAETCSHVGRGVFNQISASLLPSLDTLQSPYTILFIGLALLFGILAMLQYRINRADQLQHICLVFGLGIGVWTCLPSDHASPALMSTLSLSITSAITFSTCAHWLWYTLFSTRTSRLERKVVKWAHEAPNMTSSHIVKYYEVE